MGNREAIGVTVQRNVVLRSQLAQKTDNIFESIEKGDKQINKGQILSNLSKSRPKGSTASNSRGAVKKASK